jgi:hypothetical protein
MVESKWESSSEVDPQRECIAYAAFGKRNSVWSYFSFMMKALKFSKQLKTAKGAIAFTARLGFLSKESSMIAVFEDEKALMEFAHAGQHAQCSEQFKTVAKWKRAKWSISGSALPLKWDDAMNRIQSQK